MENEQILIQLFEKYGDPKMVTAIITAIVLKENIKFSPDKKFICKL